METTILRGTPVAEVHIAQLKTTIDTMKSNNITPSLRVILIGNDPASTIYTAKKTQKCNEIGIDGSIIHLSETCNTNEVLSQIKALNDDPTIYGILIQLPLPKHIDTEQVLQAIDPKKDVDGFHPMNVGSLQLQLPNVLIPCTVEGILALLEYYSIPVEGSNVVILGRSNIVGKPLASILSSKGNNATVTLCHSKTRDIQQYTMHADIIISAMGNPLFLSGDMIAEGSTLIDVGISPPPPHSKYFGKKKIVGDIDYESVLGKARGVSPVPGGVGPLTIAMLMKNTIRATQHICPKSVKTPDKTSVQPPFKTTR